MCASLAAAVYLNFAVTKSSLERMLVSGGKASPCEKKQGTYSKKQRHKVYMNYRKTGNLFIIFSGNTKGDTLSDVAFWWWEEVDSNYRSQ